MNNLRFVAGAAMAAVAVGVVWCGPAVASTPATAAAGYINPVSGAKLVNGDTFTVADGTNASVTFEFRSSGSPAPGNVAVPFTVGDTAATVRSKIITAVNGVGAGLNVTASSAQPGLVRLVNDNAGSAGNQPLLESVADPDFTVSGMSGGSDPTNAAPVLGPIGDRLANEAQQLQFQISATDSDGDPLTYSASNLPLGASFDAPTRTFTWTPTYVQAGSYPNVHFEVSDGTLTDSEDITITVNNILMTTTTTLSVEKASHKLTASGSVSPGQSTDKIDVTLYRQRHGKFRSLATRHPTLDDESNYGTGFPRPSSGQCRIDSSFPGSPDAEASSATKTFRC